jgi:type III secretion protein J
MSRPNYPLSSAWGRLLIALACLFVLTGCEEALYSSLQEQEANEVLAALSAEGIAARKERLEGNNWQVSVDGSRLGVALALLRSQGLPREHRATLGDVFQKQGLVSTPSEERMRYIFAVSQELSQTLSEIDGVVAARVHVVIPENDPLSTKIRPSSAAVFIKYRPDANLKLLSPTVKDLVAHGIEGLSHDQVALTLVEANRPAIALSAESASSLVADALGGSGSQLAIGVLVVLLVAGAISLVVLPALLRKHGQDWAWLLGRVFRR